MLQHVRHVLFKQPAWVKHARCMLEPLNFTSKTPALPPSALTGTQRAACVDHVEWRGDGVGKKTTKTLCLCSVSTPANQLVEITFDPCGVFTNITRQLNQFCQSEISRATNGRSQGKMHLPSCPESPLPLQLVSVPRRVAAIALDFQAKAGVKVDVLARAAEVLSPLAVPQVHAMCKSAWGLGSASNPALP